MIPHFTLYRGSLETLVIRMGDEFHLIDCNDALTWESRDAILESGCTPARMVEMGLSGMTIPKSDIKTVTITGCRAQDDVILRLKGKRLNFWLPRDYEKAELDEFFRDIPRKHYTTRRWVRGGMGRDWRTREQDPELFQRLRPLGWLWNILCIIVGGWPLAMPYDMNLWGWAVTALCTLGVILDCCFPAYFTMLIQSKRSRLRAPTHAIRLTWGMIWVLAVFSIHCRVKFHIISKAMVIPAALGLTLVMGLLLFRFCREFTEDRGAGLAAMLLVLMFSFRAFVPFVNHAFGGGLMPQTGSSVGRHEAYVRYGGYDYITFLLPDDRSVDVCVSWMEYEAYEPGQTRDFLVGTGFLGIDYAITEGEVMP